MPTEREAAIYEDCAKIADEYERSQGDDPNGFACACRLLAVAFRARAKEQAGVTTMQKPIEEALAELVSDYAKSGGKNGTLPLEQINEAMRSQIQANEESGEE